MNEKLRILWRWIRRSRPAVAIKAARLEDYFNGICPECGEHIGTDVWHDRYGLYLICGSCNNRIPVSE